jgi:mono/diheme cytochrome c family protein
MADYHLLGIFDTAADSASAINGIRGLGIPDNRITVMSGIPYQPRMLGRRKHRSRLGLITLFGTLLGILTAWFFMAGTQILFPIGVGGQSLIPIPPSVVIFFEIIMLGTMWATFFGFLIIDRLPNYRNQVYSPLLTEGHIGVSARVPENMLDRAQQVMADNSGHDFDRVETRGAPNFSNVWKFWAGFVIVVGGLVVLSLLFFYEVLKIDFPTNMSSQESIGYQQGPRLAAPAAAVPIQGPVFINGEPASQPIPSNPDSIQRGSVYFGLNCMQCHGATGVGNGIVGAFFNPKPFDLTSAQVQGLSDQDIFRVITEGFGVMPSIRENLLPSDRWDVVNYVRSLKK